MHKYLLSIKSYLNEEAYSRIALDWIGLDWFIIYISIYLNIGVYGMRPRLSLSTYL